MVWHKGKPRLVIDLRWVNEHVEKRSCKLVLIGKNLDEKDIHERFDKCIESADAAAERRAAGQGGRSARSPAGVQAESKAWSS